ncbi:MAG TPA: heat-inducible transcriptional repressor HrcA [Clostridia bacterium]|jgi:heat-inducible transcriptional repressor|nr:heat-inducible transcriptional repressor HrcA [Clostridia bacterium]
MNQKLSDRKRKILKAVVDEYILSPLPVSSSEIKNKYFSDISSATIRVELSTLEDMGYLIQPHTSAGRIPSARAYRFYVENFIGKKPLRKNEMLIIDESFKRKYTDIEDIVRASVKVISDITNYTSVIVIDNINDVLIKEIKLVGLEDHTALLIIITDSGIIKDHIIKLKNIISPNFLSDANVLLNRVFAGSLLGDLSINTNIIENELNEFRELLGYVVEIIKSYSSGNENTVFIEGQKKMLDYPDATLEQAKTALSVLENKELIADIFSGQAEDLEFSIKVGKHETCGLEKCAIMTAKYKVNGKEVGTAGVIGPERMDYSKVMSVLSYVGKAVSTFIKKDRPDDKE